MVFFPDQALKFPDPEGGSRSAARGFAAGNAARRTSLAAFQQAAEGERAERKLALETQKTEREQEIQNIGILGSILEGVAGASDDVFPQVFRAGIETAKRLGVDTSKYDGLSAPEAREQAKIDLVTLQGVRDDVLSSRAFSQQKALKEAGKPQTTINLGTEAQNKAATFASRMEAANTTISNLESVGSEPGSLVGNAMPNILKPDELQQLDTVARDFSGAILRKESGAVISEGEIQDAFLIYIPQPGDSAGTLKIKRDNRARAIENMKREAGPVESIRDVPGVVDPSKPGSSKASELPEGTVASDGTNTLIVRDGKWEPFDGE